MTEGDDTGSGGTPELDWLEVRTGLTALSAEECWDRLAEAHVGRIGVIAGQEAVVVPVNFVVDGDRIVFRTGAGTKFHALVVQGGNATLEIDEFDHTYHEGWSVMLVGEAVEVTDPDELARLESESPLRPWAGGDKSHWIAITPRRMTGRRIGRA